MTVHTPGPWRLEVGKDNLNTITDEPIYGGIYSAPTEDSEGWAIARVWSDYGNAEADARLIAAAPELLEALEQALQLINNQSALAEKMRAAIAKARGE